MNITTLLSVAIGGAIGSVARALAGHCIPAGRLPWATVLVNITGALLIGWLMARFSPLEENNIHSYSFWVLGICGGFTTFSSFSWQTLDLLLRGNWLLAVANVVLSVVLCLAATWLGWRLAR